jgi:hypothetical protein
MRGKVQADVMTVHEACSNGSAARPCIDKFMKDPAETIAIVKNKHHTESPHVR